MHLGDAYQLQIFVSLFVVLGAAFVALSCDLLRGNNEQLRVQNTELKVRLAEEQMRIDILLGEKAESQPQEAPAEAVAVAARVERNGPLLRAERKRAPAPEALAAMERGLQMAGLPRSQPQISASVATPPVNQEAELAMERLVEHAMENTYARGVDLSAARAAAQSAVFRETRSTDHAAASTDGILDTPPGAPAAGSRDWSSLLNRRTTGASSESSRTVSGPARSDLLAAVVAATNSTTPAQPSAPLPSGFQDGFALRRLIEGRQPMSGLVASISVVAQSTDNDEAATDTIPAPVRSLLESLVGASDFAMQSGAEEYLLIYPGLRGSAAQHRLSEIAQQLSAFEVRSAGQFSVQINWGGEETRSESIDEAIASAVEHTAETRYPIKKPLDSQVRAALSKAG
jgi:hypothetical protein